MVFVDIILPENGESFFVALDLTIQDKKEADPQGLLRQFSVSVRTLTVLAIKVISVKRVLGFINHTAFKEINKEI